MYDYFQPGQSGHKLLEKKPKVSIEAAAQEAMQKFRKVLLSTLTSCDSDLG